MKKNVLYAVMKGENMVFKLINENGKKQHFLYIFYSVWDAERQAKALGPGYKARKISWETEGKPKKLCVAIKKRVGVKRPRIITPKEN